MTLTLMSATPTHSGAVESVTADTLLQLQQAMLQRGDRLIVRFPSATTISTLRNLIVADFLQSDADVLFMLDADQGVGAASILRMLDSGYDVAGCLYPRRRFNWAGVSPQASGADLQTLLYQATEFVGVLADGGAVAVTDGFARADYLGAGSMMLRRPALERMAGHYPDLAGEGFDPSEFSGSRFAQNWGFFNPLGRAAAGQSLAEDYAFCHRWRAAGGELWADLTATSAHVGRHMFSGNYLDYLKARGVL